MELKRCSKCTVPITWETVYLDENGVCNICKNWEKKQNTIDWVERERSLISFFEEVKKKKAKLAKQIQLLLQQTTLLKQKQKQQTTHLLLSLKKQ